MSRNFALGLVSVLMTLLTLEIGTRIYYGTGDRIPPHPDPGIRDEWRWAAEHLRAGKPVVEGLSGYDPQLGWREPGELTDWIRRKGWNVPADPLQEGGPRRTVFIGDSFTAGLHVQPDEAFAFQFGSTFHPEEETFNLGVSGYGLDQMLLLYETEGPRLHADRVVLGLYLGGAERALSRFTYYAKPWFHLDATGGAGLAGQPVPAPQALYDAYVTGEREIGGQSWSLLHVAVSAAWQRLQSRERFRNEQSADWQLLRALLQRFSATAASLDDQLVILLIPTRLEEFPGSGEAGLQMLVMRHACASAISAVRLDTRFLEIQSRHPDQPLYRPRDAGGHFSVAGHHAAAKLLSESLRTQAHRDCNPRGANHDSRTP